MKARRLRLNYFVWIIVPILLVAIYMMYGLPHFRFSYEWRGSDYSPYSERYYTRCTAIGFFGAFTSYPTDGTCPWIEFHKSNEAN